MNRLIISKIVIINHVFSSFCKPVGEGGVAERMQKEHGKTIS